MEQLSHSINTWNKVNSSRRDNEPIHVDSTQLGSSKHKNEASKKNTEAFNKNIEVSNNKIKASMKNIENQIKQLSKQVAARSNGHFSGNTYDSPRDEEVVREVEDEWEVVEEGWVENKRK